jgi:hypothetical protein
MAAASAASAIGAGMMRRGGKGEAADLPPRGGDVRQDRGGREGALTFAWRQFQRACLQWRESLARSDPGSLLFSRRARVESGSIPSRPPLSCRPPRGGRSAVSPFPPLLLPQCKGLRILSRFRKSITRFSDKNLQQNKRLSRRSVGEATQVCLGFSIQADGIAIYPPLRPLRGGDLRSKSERGKSRFVTPISGPCA